jgi:transposase
MGRVITVEDWAEIRRLYLAERMPIKAIAKKLHLARNTVRNAVRSTQPPRYARAESGSIVDAVEPQIRDLLREFPQMPATVIAERIGWDRSMTVLKERVRVLRPVYAPHDPSSRTTYVPGEVGQCDLWFPPAQIPLGFGQAGSPPVLVLTAGYSRFLAARMIPTRHAQDIVLGQWAVIGQLGAVPRLLVWDNESGVGRYGGVNPRLTPQFTSLRGMLGTRVYVARPRDPETKGLTERNNGFFETSFLPGRRFAGPGDFNAQLAEFLA